MVQAVEEIKHSNIWCSTQQQHPNPALIYHLLKLLHNLFEYSRVENLLNCSVFLNPHLFKFKLCDWPVCRIKAYFCEPPVWISRNVFIWWENAPLRMFVFQRKERLSCTESDGRQEKRGCRSCRRRILFGPRLRSWGMKVMSSFKAASSVVCSTYSVYY